MSEILETVESYEISVLLDYEMGSLKFYYNNGSEHKIEIYSSFESDHDLKLLYEFKDLNFYNSGVSPCFKGGYARIYQRIGSLSGFNSEFTSLNKTFFIPCYHGQKLTLFSGLHIPDNL